MKEEILHIMIGSIPLGLALMFSLVFWLNKNLDKVSRNLLALFFFLFVLIQSFSVFTNILDLEKSIFLVPILLGALLAIPPTIYLYVNSLIIKRRKIKLKRFYGIPLAVVLLNFVVISLFFVFSKNDELKYIIGDVLTYSALSSLALLFPILGVFYIYRSYKEIVAHQKHIGDIYSYKQGINLQWVKLFLLGFALFFILAVFNSIFDQLTESRYPINDFVFEAIAFAYILFIGVKSLQQLAINKTLSLSSEKEEEPKEEIDTEEQEDKFEKIKLKLDECIYKEKPYLDAALSIYDLAKQIETNYKYLSKTINKEYGLNFVSFINHYRILEAKELLKNSEYDNYTIEAIGELSGFKSKSAFNGAFKKITGYTPSQFKNDIK